MQSQNHTVHPSSVRRRKTTEAKQKVKSSSRSWRLGGPSTSKKRKEDPSAASSIVSIVSLVICFVWSSISSDTTCNSFDHGSIYYCVGGPPPAGRRIGRRLRCSVVPSCFDLCFLRRHCLVAPCRPHPVRQDLGRPRRDPGRLLGADLHRPPSGPRGELAVCSLQLVDCSCSWTACRL